VGQPQPAFHWQLIVWECAIELCAAVCGLTRKFPREEVCGLTNQLRGAGVSIPSNIAEGYGRGSREQYKYFLSVAQGSYLEVQTQLVIASRLGFTDPAEINKVASLAFEVGKMLGAILRKLEARESTNSQGLLVPKLIPNL
jgi:four helix bundle protein